MSAGQNQDTEKKSSLGLALFAVYAVVLVLATVSELYNLGWFDYPIFK